MKFSTFLLIIILVVACNEESKHKLQISKLEKVNDSLQAECDSRNMELSKYAFIIDNLSNDSKKEVDSISQNAD